MLVEWHEAQKMPEKQQKWWDEHPALSCNDIVKLARKKLKKE